VALPEFMSLSQAIEPEIQTNDAKRDTLSYISELKGIVVSSLYQILETDVKHLTTLENGHIQVLPAPRSARGTITAYWYCQNYQVYLQGGVTILDKEE
jgi:hypothetical protein